MARIAALEELGRLPQPGDNCAVAVQTLSAGQVVSYKGKEWFLQQRVLEGHRFAVETIAPGEPLLSWNLPFGKALRRIEPGEYVCNELVLNELALREASADLLTKPNFADYDLRFGINPDQIQIGRQVAPAGHPLTFEGFNRGQRGVGTRNYILLLGTTSQSSSLVRMLEQRLSPIAEKIAGLDGIVAVAHTEGGTDRLPNNLELLLRTLSGFAVHPNVGAVLVVDRGREAVNNRLLKQYLIKNGFPIDQMPHQFLSVSEGMDELLRRGEEQVKEWLEPVAQCRRSSVPLARLKLALQCGGSDAFSGISGNPSAGWAARELIRYGGSVNLAETDELIGAESYILQNVADLETAQEFLQTIERFKERVGWHGHTAEGNPSGGNRLRGLYNIMLKSIGAAQKKHPEVRLDHVIDYGERMQEAGFHFMDSPGNDLESVAGQVASGANLIIFTTGNGSVTNFPFVPTLKVVTTTARYELLPQEMDFNAGRYLEGTPLEELGAELFDRCRAIAAGRKTAGEGAGHSQVSIWRDWPQTGDRDLSNLVRPSSPAGVPLTLDLPEPGSGVAEIVLKRALNEWEAELAESSPPVGLVLPTSLCSGQIAGMAARKLNELDPPVEGFQRFVSLIHTEGCGVSRGANVELYVRMLLAYLTHPLVRRGLLLEHGCETTHNRYFRHELESRNIDADEFGWASVQLDGGIAPVLKRIDEWFRDAAGESPSQSQAAAERSKIRVGIVVSDGASWQGKGLVTDLALLLLRTGGLVVVPENSPLLEKPFFGGYLRTDDRISPTLAYGEAARTSGLHLMESPTRHRVETLSGLGATGIRVLLALEGPLPGQGHPMIPTIRIAWHEQVSTTTSEDLDLILDERDRERMIHRMIDILKNSDLGNYRPKSDRTGDVDFQCTRGLLGVSM